MKSEKITKKIMLTLTIGILMLFSCKKKEINGIIIGDTLLVHQSLKHNQELTEIIKKSLNKDKSGIIQLVNFECGGGAGCYNLGFILTQIIYEINEDEFINVINQIDKKQKNRISSLIGVGLEYGDNDKDGKMDSKRIELEFPDLNKILNE